MKSFDIATLTLNPAIDQTVVIPGFTPGAVNRVERFHHLAGGKGINVAAALEGVRVAATGFLGSANSSFFETFFAEKNIADAFVRINGETRTGIKITDPVSQQTTDINFPGISPTVQDLETLWERCESLTAPWFALGGSLPPGVPADFYRELILALHKREIQAVLDTSGEPLRLGLEAAPAIVKPNLHELETLLGKPLKSLPDILQAARGLIARGVRLAVVSMGSAGACFVTEHEAVIARPPEISVGSTVGAGDAMVAGILCAQVRGLSLEECARMATAFSLRRLTGDGSAQISISYE